MRNMKLTFLGLLLLLGGVVQGQPAGTRFQQLIDSVYGTNPGSVGIMVHIEAPGYGISWSGASGISDKGTQQVLESDQPALIASSIKTYVSATILRLVESGELSIEQPIRKLLTGRTRKLFQDGGYDLDAIRIKHLLSHTSGIRNYADQDYIDFINANKTYRWTRDEQLERTLSLGGPLAPPETTYNYTDANYLLLTEIIEQVTGKPFYTSMRELLRYEPLGLDNTWFPTLEEMPAGTKPLVHQYWGSLGWDSNDIDISVDLYGGGGIACPPEDLAGFSWNLFNGNIIADTATLNLIYTEVPTQDSIPARYFLGLTPTEYGGLTGFGHGGFWGTNVLWFPELNTSIAVYILEKDQRKLGRLIMTRCVDLLVEEKK